MDNSKNNIVSVIIELVQKLAVVFLEYMSMSALSKKISGAIQLFAGGLIVLFIALLFAIGTWAGLMSILFVYLLSLKLKVIIILIIITLINLSLFLIAIFCFLRIKNKAIASF